MAHNNRLNCLFLERFPGLSDGSLGALSDLTQFGNLSSELIHMFLIQTRRKFGLLFSYEYIYSRYLCLSNLNYSFRFCR